MGAHLDNILEGFLGFVFEILGRGSFLEHVNGEKSSRDVSFGKELGVLWRMATDLSERPGRSCLQVVFGFVHECLLEWGDSLRDDNCHGKGVVEGRNVSESHDSRQASIALRLADVVHSRSSTS